MTLDGTPLSVCMFSDDFVPAATGVGMHLQAVSEHLVRRGHRVSVVTTRRPGEPVQELWRGVRVHRVPTLKVAGFYQALPSARRIGRILDAERPDLVHQHYLGLMMLCVMRVARRRGLPQVYTHHMTADVLTQPWFMRPFRPLIERQIVRSANRMDALVSVSAGAGAALSAQGVTVPVATISNPVAFADPAATTPADRDGAGFVVLYAGRLEPEKNLPLLLQAFVLLAARVPEAVLWIAGRGSQQKRLEQLARELGIAGRVRFLGFLGHDALAQRYAACDAFVLPSLVETQGLVAMEAMWFGKPVVLADSVVSAPELVVEGESGFIVDHTQPAVMSDALVRLAADAALRRRIGQAAQQAAQAWQPDHVLRQLVDTYRCALRR